MMFRYFDIGSPVGSIRCKAYYKEQPNVEKAVIFGTGFAGHKDTNAAAVFAEELFAEHDDVIVVVFNWPAHDDDEKTTLSLVDCGAYLEQVIRTVGADFGARRLFANATSFGGYMMLKYISEHGDPFEKTALRCPAVNLFDVLANTIMTKDEYDRVMNGGAVSIGFDRTVTLTRSFIEDVAANDIRQRDYRAVADSLLILHGTADEVVAFEEGERFAARQQIGFVPVPGADHRFQQPAHRSLVDREIMKFFGF